MNLTIFLVLFITSVCGLPPKHVHVSTKMPWLNAQANCRNQYTDLSPITSEAEEAHFKNSSGITEGWIGLNKDVNFFVSVSAQWKWSGGGVANYTNWIDSLFSYLIYNYALWTPYGWQALSGSEQYPSFCFNLVVVEEMMSWEQALEYCRAKYSELTSLLSETELLLALSEMTPAHVTERVWIDLTCFLKS